MISVLINAKKRIYSFEILSNLCFTLFVYLLARHVCLSVQKLAQLAHIAPRSTFLIMSRKKYSLPAKLSPPFRTNKFFFNLSYFPPKKAISNNFPFPYTGCSLNIVFFPEIMLFFWTLPVLQQRWFSSCLLCVHKLTPRENRVWNILKNSEKPQYLMNTR